MSALPLPGRSDSLRPFLGAGVVVFLILLSVGGLKSYRDLEAARARQKQLETRLHEERQGIERLRDRIERLHSDPATLERLARENLGMVRPGDVLIELPRETAPPAASAPAAPSAVPAHPASSPPSPSAVTPHPAATPAAVRTPG